MYVEVVSVALLKPEMVTETMSDEKLVKLARKGYEQAFSLLIQRCGSMVKRQTFSLRCSQIEIEDLAQEGLMGLLSAVRTYDAKTASFRTYASVCVRNRILSAIKRSGVARIIPVSELVSIDDEQQTSLTLTRDGDDPAQLVLKKEEEFRLHDRLRKLLSPKEYGVLMFYLQAYAYDEIAQCMEMSTKSVDNALQRVRKKLVSNSFLSKS